MFENVDDAELEGWGGILALTLSTPLRDPGQVTTSLPHAFQLENERIGPAL